MKNPRPNPAIEAIKSSICKKLGYIPGDNIPNSNVSKALGKLDATATLIYAKTLKKPIRRARSGECQYTLELEKEKKNNPSREKTYNGLLTTRQAAKELNIEIANLQQQRRSGKIKVAKVGGRMLFKPEDVERFKIERAIDKL